MQVINSTLKAFRLISLINPLVVITDTSVIPQFALASKIYKAKHIWFIHELVEEDFGNHYIFGKKTSKRIVGFFSDVVVANSKFVYETYRNFR